MRRISGLLILTLIFLTVGCQKKKKEGAETVVPVETFTVRPDSIEAFVEITGGLKAEKDALVYSTISEKLVEIRKEVGSTVMENEVIAVQDNDLWHEMLNQAEAALSSARVRFEQIKKDYERFERLYKEKAISQQQWDQIKANYQEAEAALRRAQAAYYQSKEQYDNTFIRAPFGGRVGSFHFNPGEMIPAGQPVARIVNSKMVRAELYLPDLFINKIRAGQSVLAIFPNYPDKHFRGSITHIDATIDPLTRTFRVDATFGNTHRLLKPGMYGKFHIVTELHSAALVVPDNAVLIQTRLKVNPETGETYTIPHKFIFVVENGRAKMRTVKTGIESRGRIEIVEGLSAGDQVIIVGQNVVKDGEKVSVVTSQ